MQILRFVDRTIVIIIWQEGSKQSATIHKVYY